ncbi:MAG: hypothetical protein CL974_04675 [Euryarchaeota archaeon]|nr:hypothetical protein [Euryarchaeota archaeon]
MLLKAIWGVYHADGGIVGELRYVFGKLRGTAHCALCDITHSYISEKKSMKECRSNSPVPFHLVHLNEQNEGLQSITEGVTPCVVAETNEGFQLILYPEELEDCEKKVESFQQKLDLALKQFTTN